MTSASTNNRTNNRAWWGTLAAREQTLILLAVALVALATLWWVLLAPALKTLGEAPARHAALDAQLQHMHALQAQAQQLKEVPRARGGEAQHTLRQALMQHLGAAAQLAVVGDRATVTLTEAPAQSLAHWLAQVRASTYAVPLEAHLIRTIRADTDVPHSSALWNGTLVLVLPAAQ